MFNNNKNNKYIHNISMRKENKFIKKELLILFMFFIISIISIYSFQTFLGITNNNLILKQTIYYILGFLIVFIISKIDINKILKYSFLIYFVNIILLILVLFLGENINGIKAWLEIPFLGSFQPSEFMKIGIILVSAKIINNSHIKNFKDELILVIKLFLVILLPSILTFLEPDTGAVIVYIVIFLGMIFISKIRSFWFIFIIFLFIVLLGFIFYLFYYQKDLFIKLLGSDFFYRLDRIFLWTKSEGMQLENSLLAIASSGLFGKGIDSIPIYYPEGHTDFIFTSFGSCFGLVGMILLILLFILFDLNLLNECIKNNNYTYKAIIVGFISVLLYQQIQNIAMTVGLLPITGITLPFISYGGSSLISFMILLGIVFSINKKTH